MGDEVIGDVSALHYSTAIDTPENAALREGLSRQYGKVPGYYSENNYTTAMWIDEAIKKPAAMAGAGAVHQDHAGHQAQCPARPGRDG